MQQLLSCERSNECQREQFELLLTQTQARAWLQQLSTKSAKLGRASCWSPTRRWCATVMSALSTDICAQNIA